MKDTFEAVVEREASNLERQKQRLERRIRLLSLAKLGLHWCLACYARAPRLGHIAHDALTTRASPAVRVVVAMLALTGFLLTTIGLWTKMRPTDTPDRPEGVATTVAPSRADARATVETVYRLASGYAANQRLWRESMALEDQNRGLRAANRDATRTLTGLKHQIDHTHKLIEAGTETVRNLNGQLARTKADLTEADRQRGQARADLKTLTAQLAQRRRELTQIAAQDKTNRRVIDSLKKERRDLAKRQSRLTADVKRLERRRNDLQRQVSDLEPQRRSRQAGTAEGTKDPADTGNRQAATALQSEVVKLRRQKARMRRELQALDAEAALARQTLTRIQKEIEDRTRDLNSIINRLRDR